MIDMSDDLEPPHGGPDVPDCCPEHIAESLGIGYRQVDPADILPVSPAEFMAGLHTGNAGIFIPVGKTTLDELAQDQGYDDHADLIAARKRDLRAIRDALVRVLDTDVAQRSAAWVGRRILYRGIDGVPTSATITAVRPGGAGAATLDLAGDDGSTATITVDSGLSWMVPGV
jgi:hypothetical protein